MIPMVSMTHICFSYTDGKTEYPVLAQVSLTVLPGEFVCILGNSGCGKSTLLRVLAGFESYSSGSLLIEDRTVTAPSMDRIMIFQEFDQLFPWKTVYENLLLPLRRRYPQKTGSELKAYILSYLERAGMGMHKDKYPHELSGGMKQRTALARALAIKPKVLLMDEPFASLDPKSRRSQQRLVIDLWKESETSVVFVTHDVSEAILLSDTLYTMDEGEGGRLDRYDNPLERPRRVDMDGFDEYCAMIHRTYE